MDDSAVSRGAWPVERGNESSRLDGLAARVAEGDRNALAEIYELLADDLYVFVRAQAESDGDAEEVVADVFRKAWRSAHSYRKGSGNYERWLYAIARNATRDYRKRLLRAQEAALPPLVRLGRRLSPRKPLPESAIERALATLTDAQREVVILRYFQQKSFADISRITGRKEGALRVLLHRAMKAMNKVIADAET